MEIIEKQVEKVKEVPADGYGWDGYRHDRYASKGVAGTGLGLGIAGTALGLLALGRNGGFNLFGGNNSGMPQNVNINTDSSNSGLYTIGGAYAPTAFQAWEKGCEDSFNAQKSLYEIALAGQVQRFNDRQTIDSELFSLYKGQVDADFGLYKTTRDGFDVLTAKHNKDAFDLYKGQRDGFDVLNAKINDLETKVAVNAAIRPYQDKLIQCEIDKAFTAGINYTDRRTCRMIEGQVVLPATPAITGFGSYDPCHCGCGKTAE